MVDLNTLIPPGSNLTLTYAVGINDRGEIAGFGVPVGVSPDQYETQGHAYILIPCDENRADSDGCESEVNTPGNHSDSPTTEPSMKSQLPAMIQVRPSVSMRLRTHE
jgi:hypothetical protein